MNAQDRQLQAAPETARGFGTVKGVFIPSILTILGVIMYLRLGWVVGETGLWGSLGIILLSSSITFITGLSIAATATNMKVRGGGAYYMVSRSLGVEAGAAIGLPLYLAQALGITFYLTGFSESIQIFFPDLNIPVIGLLALVFLTGLAFFSANWALKTQGLILSLILLSLVSFFFGKGSAPSPESVASFNMPASFWMVFAVFFPAVTGIEAGVALSGDLKDPSRSLPRGTLAAVVTGCGVYCLIACLFFFRVPVSQLQQNPMIMRDVAWIPGLIYVGLWGATLSSALGALLGGPRTLQAMAKDHIIPRWIGRGHGAKGEPRLATLLTFFLAGLALFLGNLNQIAALLSMFFLTSYLSLNLIAGLEGLIGSPSWRPTFRTPSTVSLLGALLCGCVMFLIDMPRALLSLVCCAGLYLWMARREMRAGWPDLRRSFYLFLARTAIIRLSGLMAHARYWRPHMLVLSGSPKSRWYLIELADAILHGKGFLTVTSILTNPEISSDKVKDLEQSTRSFLEKKEIPALVKIKKAPELIPAIRELIVDYGLGPLAPNTLVLGETEIEANVLPYATLLQTLALIQKNAIIICENSCLAPRTWPGMPDRRIDLWWGRESRNGSLMLTLGHLLKTSPEWGGARLCMHSLVEGEEAQAGRRESLQSLVRKSRMHAEITVHLCKEDTSLFQQIGEHSREADILFLGMRKPGPEESTESYADYYRKLLESIQEYPLTILTMAGEEIDFEDILI